MNNLLHKEGEAYYYGRVLDEASAWQYYDVLWNEIEWKQDVVKLYGKEWITRRKTAWYGDNGIAYTYGKLTRYALPWTPALLALKALTEKITGSTYNSCLLNLYHHGNEGMGWHSDDEPEMKWHASIASLSLGAARRFDFRHRTTGETLSVVLEHGSLLEMKGGTQHHWKHQMPKTTKVLQPRINLTFRTVVPLV
ncbi:MAG TPA: alpha-ketoglutarate-dependent dioxygenase AlkB [Ferruginibacter sp.]|nr:alpha-ketoglutarate-dependent dioxygenase AlkB [Ferruginibacter sp.]HRO06475.1 alpha-ketoglutarate-dependent dioxygenase AlkB [Ferruginibacter sp.]HRO96696.1 alpha-ketoglutarate-dependent dioxygenase AlkB [Ferruginibacter sp.]HRP50233.1 alpha-ketoglutarate-dependent dioxygenase AlkB [Ferruginibacter sp.]